MATILPANAANKALVWSSSNPAVAAVDPVTGAVTALKLGEAVITAASTDGNSVKGSYAVKVTDGKVAQYSFEGNLNDFLQLSGAGSVAGAKLDSPTVGSITYGNGIAGQAAVFDGKSGIVLPKGLINSKSYSVSMWLKADQLTDYTTAFFGAASGNRWISFVPQRGADKTLLWSGEKWYDALTGMQIPANEWTHVAFTVDDGTVKVYINGVEKFSGKNFPNVFTDNNGVFALGINYWDVPFKGMIDEVKIYNNSLTADEVLADYNVN